MDGIEIERDSHAEDGIEIERGSVVISELLFRSCYFQARSTLMGMTSKLNN